MLIRRFEPKITEPSHNTGMALLTLRVLLGIGVVVAFGALYSRPVFPETASNHTLKTFVGLGSKFMHLVGSVAKGLGFSSVSVMRAMLDVTAVFDKPSNTVQTYITTMDGVEVMIFKPVGDSADLRPGIIHIHGGGWTYLSAQLYAPLCKEIVDQTQSVLVSVKGQTYIHKAEFLQDCHFSGILPEFADIDTMACLLTGIGVDISGIPKKNRYRLAPEHIYPIPLEDCLKAARYFLRNAKDYGVDQNRVGVKGDSAGGNLAMAVALKLSREENLPSLKFMSLDYPVLQFFDFTLPSYQKYESGPGICTKGVLISHALLYAFGHLDYFDMFSENIHVTRDMKNSRYGQYVSVELLPEFIQKDANYIPSLRTNDDSKLETIEEIMKKITDPLLAPLMASDDDIRLLPPTYLFVAEFDVLRDDSFLLAARLKRVGVEVIMTHLVAEEHGFLNFISLDDTVRGEVKNFTSFFNHTLLLLN